MCNCDALPDLLPFSRNGFELSLIQNHPRVTWVPRLVQSWIFQCTDALSSKTECLFAWFAFDEFDNEESTPKQNCWLSVGQQKQSESHKVPLLVDAFDATL